MNSEELSILVIEDDPSDAALIRRFFADTPQWQARLVIQGCLAGGLIELSGGEIDVVLLDYHLGAETGLTFLGAMREAGHTTPVVVLTGRGDEKLAVEALEAGAADYMPKSRLSPSSLQRSVTNAVEKARLRRLIGSHHKNLERSNSDLARRNQEIENFYHTLSHELKTPLTAMREFLSIVLDGVAGELNQEQSEYLEIARGSCSHMDRCIDDLLDVTRLETGKLQFSPKPTDLGGVIHSVARAMAPAAGERGIHVEEKVEGDLPLVNADESRIAQILRNLLSNALKFTTSGGQVQIAATRDERSGGQVTVAVTDTGRGIPQERLHLIFDRLYQVRECDYSTQGGMGLGLSICKELVELHGGQLHVESRFGEGSTFSFQVAACERTTPRRPQPANDASHAKQLTETSPAAGP